MVMFNAPTSFRSGDSVAWTEHFPDYPAFAGWSLSFRLMWRAGSGATAVDIAAQVAADDEGFAVTLTAVDTAGFLPGMAYLAGAVARNTDRVTLGGQTIEILPDLATAQNYDTRSENRRTLDDLNAALADYITRGNGLVASYSIANRSRTFRSVDEIRLLITFYEQRVAAENALTASLAGASNHIQVRF